MAWGYRFYLLGFAASGLIALLAGCSGFFFAQREPWRHDAEVECLTSGAVREGPGIVMREPISGPGICGADFPLKISALGASGPLGFADDPRPPGIIAGSPQPPWPGYPEYDPPVTLAAPGANAPPRDAGESYDFRRPYGVPAAPPDASSTPVAVTPTATLACPIVAELQHWIAEAVQPAALRWLGSPVSEIRQISAYSCRGMNGNPHAHISEHAFGNALDIAAFTLADGRTITVKAGWRGLPEEQGFLRDIQAAACDQFTTVLAPGSNVYHYDHIHVDLMRRGSGHRACNPRAVSGEEVAARAAARYAGGARRFEPRVTGSVGQRAAPPPRGRLRRDPDDRFPALPLAEPGNDGTWEN